MHHGEALPTVAQDTGLPLASITFNGSCGANGLRGYPDARAMIFISQRTEQPPARPHCGRFLIHLTACFSNLTGEPKGSPDAVKPLI